MIGSSTDDHQLGTLGSQNLFYLFNGPGEMAVPAERRLWSRADAQGRGGLAQTRRDEEHQSNQFNYSHTCATFSCWATFMGPISDAVRCCCGPLAAAKVVQLPLEPLRGRSQQSFWS